MPCTSRGLRPRICEPHGRAQPNLCCRRRRDRKTYKREEGMTRNKPAAIIAITLSLLMLVGSATTMVAQTKVEGMIKARNGSQIILQTTDSPKVIVLLT